MLIDRIEVARLLSISPGSVDNMRNRGELASVKLGARRLYHVDDLAALIAKKREVLS